MIRGALLLKRKSIWVSVLCFCQYTAVSTGGVNNLTDPDPGIEPLKFRTGGTGGKLISGSVNNSGGSEAGY